MSETGLPPYRTAAFDVDRAVAVIQHLRLHGPNDPVGEHRVPKDPAVRDEVADVVYDLADEHAAAAYRRLRPGMAIALPPAAGTAMMSPRER